MEIKMNEAVVKETFGDAMLLGLVVRHPYDEITRTRVETEIESIQANIACSNLDESIVVNLDTKVIPNIKKWGKVRFEGLVYSPTASANSFTGNDGNARSFGRINDRFLATNIVAMTPADKVADENGEKVPLEKSK